MVMEENSQHILHWLKVEVVTSISPVCKQEIWVSVVNMCCIWQLKAQSLHSERR